MIIEFLEKKIPQNWDQLSLQERRMFWNGNLKYEDELVPREKVCAMEIWTECLNGDTKYFKRSDSTEINNILTGLGGWERNKSKRRFGPYGILAGFERRCPRV